MSSFRRRSAVSQAVLCMGLAFSTSMAFGQAPGDVNGDGLLDIADVGLIKDHLLERSALQGAALTRADTDSDGSIRTADLVYVINHMTTTYEITINLPGNVPLVMVFVPAGNFQMGTLNGSAGDPGWALDREAPQHGVTVPSFYMGKYELTQQQWLALMVSWPGPAPSSTGGLGDNHPAYYVSWNDAQNFITALNTHVTNTGQGPATFRLPSESEWEYACRSGSPSRFWFGDSTLGPTECNPGPAGDLGDYAWFCGNNNRDGHPYGSKQVGTKLPNAFGLHDMHGNVFEWCQDWYHSTYTGAPADGSAWEVPVGTDRVCRGGYWYLTPYYCRSAYRYSDAPGSRIDPLGFRLSRTP